MKKIILSLVLLASVPVMAQTCVPGSGITCSPNLNLWIPPLHYPDWNVPLNANWSLIDGMFSGGTLGIGAGGTGANTANGALTNLGAQPVGAYITGATLPLGISVTNITCPNASSSVGGCLTSADWTVFNAKQAAGSYLTTSVAASTYEPLLGNPSTNGYVLSSTTLGVRSWIANGGGGTVTISGSPVGGNIASFSSSTIITPATSANIQTAIGASVYDAYGAATTAIAGSMSGTAAHATAAATAGTECTTGQASRGVDTNWNAIGCFAPPSNSAYYDMVAQGGIDNTGATIQGAAIVSIIIALGAQPLPIYFPPGTYNINDGIDLPCTTSTCQGLTIFGAGKDSTLFQSTCTNGYAWWINSSATGGSYNYGGDYDSFRVNDTSGTGACNSLFKISRVENYVLWDIELDGAKGVTYSTGTASVANGSTAVTGSGTTWTAAMVNGILAINGKPQFVCAFVSTTSVTLCGAWQQTTAVAQGYSISYNGNGLLLDGGGNYNQYGDVYNLTTVGDLNGVGTVPSTVGGVGVSRNKFYGGFINGQRIPNSKGFALGRYTDTIQTDTAINSVSTCWFIDGANSNKITGECEDDGAPTVVTTCNGGVASKACINGAEVTGASGSTTFQNIFSGILVTNTGVAIQRDSTNAADLMINNLRDAYGSDTQNYNFEGVNGCPANGSGVTATIFDYDCVHTQVAVTVN